MPHKLLNADGTVSAVSTDQLAAAIIIDAADAAGAIEQLMALTADQTALVEVPDSADGRSFSVIAYLSASNKQNMPSVWLTGDILPDQVSLAMQCGASGVVISEESWQARGTTSWQNSLNPVVKVGYRAEVWEQVSNISLHRKLTHQS